MKRALAGTTVLLLSLSGCSSTPQICDADAAREAGRGTAMRGEPFSLAAGSVCRKGHRKIFRVSFTSGYQEGRARYCDPSDLEKAARAAGEAGSVLPYQEARFRICDNTADLRAAVGKGGSEGLGTYCSTGAVRAVGKVRGTAGQSPDFPRERYAICRTKGRALRGAFAQGYRDGLTAFCGKNSVEAEAAHNAERSGTDTLPDSLSICLKPFPRVPAQYREVFALERKKVVETQCTYERGLDRGASDAKARHKNMEMPPFCNQSRFPVYLQGYREGW